MILRLFTVACFASHGKSCYHNTPNMPNHSQQSLDTMQVDDTFSSLSIIKLGESLSAGVTDEVTRVATRMSDASSNAPQSDVPTPASLEADLTHYKVCRSRIV